MSSIIKAPFNFVPLNHEIFYPEWADFISQDLPLPGAVSGKLSLRIEACSPIFVRNGELGKDYSFSQFGGKYFLPGTSVKGMLRSVLEILSYGKLGIFGDNRYAVRDLNNRDVYMNYMVPQDRNGQKFIRCGWLRKESHEDQGAVYKLSDRGEPLRAPFERLDQMFGTDMHPYFQRTGKYDSRKEEHKSAAHKYRIFEKIKAGETVYNFKGNGQNIELTETGIAGKVIFTGQPGVRQPRIGRQPGRGKGSEFIFPEKEIREYVLEQKVVESFHFAYFDHDKDRQSIDWKRWKPLLDKGKPIPVFFQISKDKTRVIHLGLSYLYKLPYNNSIGDYVQDQPEREDLAECIFGRIEHAQKGGASFKGRVHIGHAFAQGAVKPLPKQKEVLNSPKASYYPIYTKQKDVKNGKVSAYKTFMNGKGETGLSGRKRYVVQNTIRHNPPPVIKDVANDKITTTFIPLDKGAVFHYPIYYHNLLPAELGALLSAITFHQTPGCYHSLGMAKPLGYGKVRVSVEGMSAEEQTKYLTAFEACMNAFTEHWASSPALTELVTMATEQAAQGNATNSPYMQLADFKNAKNEKEVLDMYSKLDGIKIKRLTSLSPNKKPAVDAVFLKYAELKNALNNALNNASSKRQPNEQKAKTERPESQPIADDSTSKAAEPQYLQKGNLNPKKRYQMHAVVCKSGTPNMLKIYVREGFIQENVRLDLCKVPLSLGTLVLVEVSVDGKGKVVQASLKGLVL